MTRMGPKLQSQNRVDVNYEKTLFDNTGIFTLIALQDCYNRQTRGELIFGDSESKINSAVTTELIEEFNGF